MSTDPSTALLVVDVQRDVMATSVRSDEIVANVATLVDRARDRGAPVVWVRHRDGGLVADTPGWQIVDALAPAPGEPIVEKTFADSFASTDLADRLGELGVTDLVLCGAQTDACIRGTFYGGLYRGYPVTVVADAHTTEDMREWGSPVGPEEAIGLFNLHASFTRLPDVAGSVVTTAEALGGS